MTDGSPRAYFLVGPPAAGKSTWANIFVEDPSLVASTDNTIDMIAKHKGITYNEAFSNKTMRAAISKMRKHILELVSQNKDVYVDQTNMTVKSRARKLVWIPRHYTKIAIVFEKPDDEEWKRRLNSRPGKTIPEKVLRNMIDNYEPPTKKEGFDIIWNWTETMKEKADVENRK